MLEPPKSSLVLEYEAMQRIPGFTDYCGAQIKIDERGTFEHESTSKALR